MGLQQVGMLLLLAISGTLAAYLYRYRRKWKYPLPDSSLIPAYLFAIWLAGLFMGQFTHSLLGAAATAAAGLFLVAIGMIRRSAEDKKITGGKWTILDWASFFFLSYSLLRIWGNDNPTHYAVVNTLLRGNVPASSFNDPGFPLVYHYVFDLAAAVFGIALKLLPEQSLDVMAIVCVSVLICSLHFLSRLLLKTSWGQQCGRLFFLFGLGPTYLNLKRGPGSYLFEEGPISLMQGGFYPRFLHGRTTQSYAEAIFRLPMGLNYITFVSVLSLLIFIYLFSDSAKERKSQKDVILHLVPFAILLPLTSEELTVFSTIAIGLLCLRGSLGYKTGLVWLAIVVSILPLSGVFRAMTAANTPAPVPVLALNGHLAIPRWPETPRDIDTVVLFSMNGLNVLFLEWGPVFLAGLILPFLIWNRIRILLVCFILISFAPPFVFHFKNWVTPDLDRFFFYGTAVGFLLAAIAVDLIIDQGWPKLTAGIIVVIFAFLTIVSPIGYLYVRGNDRPPTHYWSSVQFRCKEIQNALQIVQSKEMIQTDIQMAQSLIMSGFIVPAPMDIDPASVSPVDFKLFRVPSGHNPEWLFYPPSDPRVAGKSAVATFDGYVLVRAY